MNKKEIPLLVNVEFDGSDIETGQRLMLFNYDKRINKGYPFTYWEFDEYCGILLDLNEENKINKKIIEYCYENFSEKIIKDNILYHLLKFKFLKKKITDEEFKKLLKLYTERRKISDQIFLKAINDAGVSKKKTYLYQTELNNLKTFSRHFTTQTLVPCFVPVYLDLEMLLHIYVRHTSETSLGTSNYQGRTLFQYKIEDILTLLKAVIKVVEEDIKEHFIFVSVDDTKNDFHKKRIYFNEDYYQLKINTKGRIIQFHQIRK